MRQYEYRIHHVKLAAQPPADQQLVEILNQFGAEGWRLNRLYGEASVRSLSSWKGGVNLLLEREATA